MLVSNFKVYQTQDGNGAINFTVGNELRKVIIPKGDHVPKQVFDLYYGQLKSFKERHYAIAKWIVKDIRRMGYEFKEMPLSAGIYLPVKTDESIEDDYPKNISREDRLRYLWNEVERISKKLEEIVS